MKRKLLLSVFLLACFTTVLANAQVDLSPGVARISLIQGDVSTQRGDTNDWSAAALNQPVVAGDKVSTGDRSRAEVQLDHANILRLGNNSQAHIASLTRTNIQVQVGQGLAFYSVFKESDAEIEIDTPNVAVRPTSREGVYRIEVRGGETEVTVRKGSADISTPQGSARVEKGQSAIVRGNADSAEYKVEGAASKDSWDSWSSERDGVIRNAQAWGRTNRYYVGSEDLDAYGRWINVPDYGYVWSPIVAVGWAPYRAGRWVWQPYWGWTWVSYEPWGWAPYHYGRWFPYGGSWVWWPGPVYPRYRPVWAPAYVSFFGFGRHWGVGFGFGSVGWLPIGPCDRFYPWWGAYRSHFNVVNATNITNIHHGGSGIAPLHGGSRYSNLRQISNNDSVRRAISTVPAEHFGTGRSTPNAVSKESFRDGQLLAGNVPIVPTRAATSVTDRPASGPTYAGQQRFFTKSRPGTAPESFDSQARQVQDAIQRSGRFTPTGADAQSDSPAKAGKSNRGETQAFRPAEPARDSANTASHGGGWRRFGSGEAQNRPPDTPAKSTTGPPAKDTGQPREDAPAPRRDAATGTSSERYGWKKFSGADAGQNRNRATPAPERGPTSASPNEYRNARPSGATTSSPAQKERPAERNDGWQKFTPQPDRATTERPERQRSTDQPVYRNSPAGESRTPPNYYTRAERENAYRESPSGRPPLDLRQPIVTPRPDRGATRSYESSGSRGAGRSAPSGGSSGGGHSAPSGGSSGGGKSHQSSSGRSR